MEKNSNPPTPDQSRSIDQGQFIPIHGIDQWLTIHGSHSNNPVLLILTGPGAAFSRMAPFFAPWENHFTLVQWDQPGAGATYGKNGDEATGPLTLDRIARDGLAITDFIRQHLQVNKIILLGISGGSIIALKMITQRPEIFSAYVGTGQVVDWARQASLSYAMVLEQARATQDQSAIAELEQIGPPPYHDAATDAIESKYAGALTPAEQANFTPHIMAAIKSPPPDASYIAPGVPTQDVRTVAMQTYEKLRNEITTFNARLLTLNFNLPMSFFQGERDAYTVTSEVQSYVSEIHAPKKQLVLIPGVGHSAVFLRDEFLALLNTHVRPLAAQWPSTAKSLLNPAS